MRREVYGGGAGGMGGSASGEEVGTLLVIRSLGSRSRWRSRAALIGMPDEADGLAGDMTALGIIAPGQGLLGADRREIVRLNTELTYINKYYLAPSSSHLTLPRQTIRRLKSRG